MVLGLIDNLGFGEFTIVAVVALLVFGKRLPQVAGQAGAYIARLRRTLDSAWRDSGVGQEIRSVQRELQNAVPRDLSIGEMARMASADIQRNLREVEAEVTVPRSLPSASAKTPDAPSPPAKMPDTPSPPAVSDTTPSSAGTPTANEPPADGTQSR